MRTSSINNMTFGAKLSSNVSQIIKQGESSYAKDDLALDYYKKRSNEVKTLAPDLTVTTENINGNMVNPYGDEVVVVKKGSKIVDKCLTKDTNGMKSRLSLDELKKLDGVTQVANILKKLG